MTLYEIYVLLIFTQIAKYTINTPGGRLVAKAGFDHNNLQQVYSMNEIQQLRLEHTELRAHLEFIRVRQKRLQHEIELVKKRSEQYKKELTSVAKWQLSLLDTAKEMVKKPGGLTDFIKGTDDEQASKLRSFRHRLVDLEERCSSRGHNIAYTDDRLIVQEPRNCQSVATNTHDQVRSLKCSTAIGGALFKENSAQHDKIPTEALSVPNNSMKDSGKAQGRPANASAHSI